VMKKHPGKRLTTPDDVGHAIVALSAPGMNWVTGNTITIDGGEQIAGG
jgi:NAD(P)-dependent dehydrogenase (short-subunit alcohol dehydrogenase family)